MSSQPLVAPTTSHRIALPRAGSMAWPLAGITLMLALHLAATFWRWINWDEFIVYSQIHQLARGELSLPLQTFQTRLFQWILGLGLSNIDQIIAARGVMFGFLLATAGAVFAVAERFTQRRVALACALSWLSMGFVLQHATALRTDPMAAALLMTSLAVMVRSRLGLGASLLVAGLAAFAALVTLKCVLYAPAFAGVAWLRWSDAGRSRQMGMRLLALALLVPALFALMYLVHSSQLPAGTDARTVATQSAALMFRPFVMEHWQHLVKGAFVSPFLTVLIGTMMVLLVRKNERPPAERWALAGMALPLSAFLFYTNAYAYFFVFILPPVCVACLVSIEAAIRRYSLAMVSIALTANGAAICLLEDLELQGKQRQIVDAADQIFPQSVTYFDGSAQLGQFRKANVLLDAWNIEAYRFGGYAVSMEAATEREPIPLLLVNTSELIAVLEEGNDSWQFQPGDIAMLRDTYIRFWGPYFVAGEALRPGESRTAKIRVPGPYTVRGGLLSINGVTYLPGEVIRLQRGTSRLTAGSSAVRLVWGDRLAEPAIPAPIKPYWNEF